MSLNEIGNLLNEVERSNFRQSLLDEYDLGVLSTNFNTLISLKNKFLLSNMNNYSACDIEAVRFKLVECIMNTKISIKELKGISTADEIEELKKLYLMKID
ncbi:MAG: hypothetical protein ACREV6_01975 [Clostridium sp.]|uniref:hypothetical protein n=1 Tax=Clostridium sp. TaxID=1506 RepID=UPI003D6CE312